MAENVKTWVLLRGLTREQRHWENFPDKLQLSFPNANILTPDLPGNGQHANVKSASSIYDMMQFVRNDIANILDNGSVHIIGLSMGAMVAIEWMKHYPQECAASILLNTSLKGISPFYHRLRPGNYHRIFYALFSQNFSAREEVILKLTSNLYSDKAPLLKKWIAYAKENSVGASNALRQLMAASRYHSPTQKPETPILILRSKHDKLVNSKSSVSLAENWGLPLETHPHAGHDLTLDDGDWVCEKIEQWFAGDLEGDA